MFIKINLLFIDKYIQKASMKKKLKCSDDIVKAIEIGALESNEFRKSNLNLPSIKVQALKYKDGHSSNKKMSFHIEDIESYYNLRNILKVDGNSLINY